MEKKSNRVLFLDNLRTFIVFLVVILHGLISYMDYAPTWWYVINPQHSLFLTRIVQLIDVPIMMILFFISGYFILPSVAKRDQTTFLKDKFLRIGLPWILGVALLAPLTSYITFYSRHLPMDFTRFITHDFWTLPFFEQSVYWYLGILLLFFTVFSLVYYGGGFQTMFHTTASSPPSWKMLSVFWVILTVAMLGLLHFFSIDSWFSGWYVLVFQPVRAPLYMGYFILGMIAYRNGWFAVNGYKPPMILWMCLWICSGLFYIGTRPGLWYLGNPSVLATDVIDSALFNAFCLASLFFGLAVFQRHFNSPGPFQKSMADNSFGIYFIHPLILYPMVYLFVGISLELYLKATVVILTTFFLSWLASDKGLRRLPIPF